MTDLNESVIMPREDFLELSEAAWNQTYTTGERIAGVAQTTITVFGISAAVAAGTWGWAKALDWLEDRRYKRVIAERQFEIDNNLIDN